MIFADLETHPIARANLAPVVVCAQWAVDDRPTHLRLRRDVPWRELLADTIVGANFAYDMACICAMDPELIPLVFAAYDEGRVVDVQLDGKLLDIAAGEYEHRKIRGWNLQELARRAGVRIDKDEDDETGDGSWRLRFAALDGIPVENWPAGAVRYATAEIPATRAVYRAQQEARRAWQAHGLDPLGHHSAHAAASAFALHLASVQGIHTDPRSVEIVSARVESYLAGLRRRLTRAGLVRENGSCNTRAAARAMVRACTRAGREIPRTDGAEKKRTEFVEKWNAAPSKYKGKALERRLADLRDQWVDGPGEKIHLPGVKLDRDVAILSASRVLEAYCEYDAARDVRTRIDRLRQGYVLPLQARFDALKETARTSCTQPQEPLIGDQLQNHPKASGITPAEKKAERLGKYFVGLRECFRPPPGYVFIIADFSMAELHTLSQICIRLFGRSVMADMLNAGKDLHIHFAMSSLGRAYESYDKKRDKTERDRAKPANFGYPGGMGPDKFIIYSRGYGVRFTRDEAVERKQAWLATYPEMSLYLDWIARQLGDRDTFTHVHPVTGFVRGGCFYTSGANHGFQHLCAYGAKHAMYDVTRACFDPSSALFGCRPWNFVHDEIIAIAPIDTAPEAAVEMGRIMGEAFNQYVPDVPTRAEPLVASVWSKKAEPRYGASGRLIPWTPPEVA